MGKPKQTLKRRTHTSMFSGCFFQLDALPYLRCCEVKIDRYTSVYRLKFTVLEVQGFSRILRVASPTFR